MDDELAQCSSNPQTTAPKLASSSKKKKSAGVSTRKFTVNLNQKNSDIVNSPKVVISGRNDAIKTEQDAHSGLA